MVCRHGLVGMARHVREVVGRDLAEAQRAVLEDLEGRLLEAAPHPVTDCTLPRRVLQHGVETATATEKSEPRRMPLYSRDEAIMVGRRRVALNLRRRHQDHLPDA